MIKDAIAQYMMIPMGMGLYYTWVWKTYWKPLFKKSQYQGEIGSSDNDDPFTQEEKIGNVEEDDDRRPNTNQKEKERQRQDNRSDRQYEQDYRNYMQERDEKYVDPYQDYPSFYT